MQELIDQLMVYLRGAWIYRWFVHLIAWPLCLAGWIFVHYLPDQYESSAKVYVDTDSILRPLLQGLAVGSDINEQIRMMTQTLLSRPNLEKVIRMNDLDLAAKTPQEKEVVLQKLQRSISIEGRYKDNLYRIRYINENPQRTKQVVESLLTIFIESSLGGSRSDSDSAQRFIEAQIKEYEKRLSDAETKLKEFKQKNLGLMPADGRDYFQRLREAMVDLEQSKMKLREVEFKRDELRNQIMGEEPTFGMMEVPIKPVENFRTSVDGRIVELEKKLDELLVSYTRKHPDVSFIERKLEDLRKQQETEIEEKKKLYQANARSQESYNIKTNPTYQRMKLALSEAEADVAALRVRVAQYKERVDYLEKMVNTIPQVEAELVQLNRDYEINKQNYETLITRRESAKISEQADISSDNVKFKIVEPALVPLDPVGPNRILFSSVILFAGLVIGAVFAFFLSQIKPTFHDRRTITDVLGVAYLGRVSIIRTSKQLLVRKLEIFTFSLVFFGLMGLYAGYVALEMFAQ